MSGGLKLAGWVRTEGLQIGMRFLLGMTEMF